MIYLVIFIPGSLLGEQKITTYGVVERLQPPGLRLPSAAVEEIAAVSGATVPAGYVGDSP